MPPRVTVQLDTRLRATVLVNPRAGHDAVTAPAIAAALDAAGVEPAVLQADGAHLCAKALDAVKEGHQIIVAAGGDGTVSTVASALAGTDVALGVYPQSLCEGSSHSRRSRAGGGHDCGGADAARRCR
jgi:hypothetical protein